MKVIVINNNIRTLVRFMKSVEISTPMDRNFDSLATIDFGPYEDRFIVIIDGKIVDHGKDEKELVRNARREYPGRIPFVVKVPNKTDSYYV